MYAKAKRVAHGYRDIWFIFLQNCFTPTFGEKEVCLYASPDITSLLLIRVADNNFQDIKTIKITLMQYYLFLSLDP